MIRMSWAQPQVRILDEPTTYTTHDPWVETAVPGFWSFARQTGEGKIPGRPGFSRLRHDDAIWADDIAIDAAFDFIRDVAIPQFMLRATDPIGVGEYDRLRTFTAEIGYRPHWMLITPSSSNTFVDPRLVDEMVITLKTMRADLNADPTPARSNAGWPTFQPQEWGKIIGACLQHEDGSADEFNTWASLPEEATLGFGLSSRTGPVFKFEPQFVREGVNLVARTETRGCYCRRRHVYMGSASFIIALEPFAAALKEWRLRVPGLWHTGLTTYERWLSYTQRNPRGVVTREGDLSAYDLSLSSVLFDAVVTAAKRAGVPSRLMQSIEAWRYAESRPIITPQVIAAPRVVHRQGGLRSGLLTTSGMGTFLNWHIALIALENCGFSNPRRSIMTGEILLFMQGDDTLYAGPPIDADVFNSTYDEMGLKMSLIDGRRFLMRNFTPHGEYGLASRMIQRTLFNEHASGGDDYGIIARIGLAARWGNGPIDSYSNIVREAISFTRLSETGTIDGPSAERWLTRNAGLVQSFLKSRASESYIERIRRDAPYSPASALILRMLIAKGVNIDQGDDRRVWDMMHRVYRMRKGARLGLAKTIWNAHNDGVAPDDIMGLASRYI